MSEQITMSSPFETVEKVLVRKTPEESFARIADEARQLGFEYCCHGLRMPLPITRPRTVFFCNYDPVWERVYHERGYINIDPTIAHGMRSSNPVVWSDEFFAAVPEFWKEAQSYGLKHGWAQSRRDPEGTFSLLVLARSGPPIGKEELAEKEERIQWLVHTSHNAIKMACQDPEISGPPVKLTDREIEVLRWTAEGKTSSEIAEFMRLSERTVNFHVNTAVEKLGASNKTSAAVRAAMLGLIW
jgi:LuxR family quorum-sensing system transcriptional regulator SolR